MKKILYSVFCVAGLLAVTSCEDYLEVSSPSVVDADFVFSNSTTTRAALTGSYSDWRGVANSYVFGAGNFYALDVAGSDIERHPEAYANQKQRHIPESFYENGTMMGEYYPDTYLNYFKDDSSNAYNKLFGVLGKVNAVITAMEGAANYDEIIGSATEPTSLSQMYGEAVALKATVYRELIKYYGDVPYVEKFGEVATGLSPRDSIYDVMIAKLEFVENLMFPIGSIPGIEAANKSYFSKTYVQGLIGRMCLEAGGYQTRRDDIKPVDGNGNPLTIETKGKAHNNATYGRRSDWENLYAKAKGAYERLLEDPGTAKFHLTDPRSADNGRIYGNPHQYFFQQMHDGDAVYADESIYEYPMQQSTDSDERSYSSGRPSNGNKNNHPNKAYGQARINPAYYYGYFDPNDMRRDVAVATTGSSGQGLEILLPFAPGNTCKGGGLSMNKFDENRQKTVYITSNRRSGINGPYMRMAEVYLGYAEVCAALNENTMATQYLKLVRERSFPAGKANTDAIIAKHGLLEAIIEERGFEYAGEGDRRFTLIRTGLLADRIQKIKELTSDMMDGLEANGSYKFENGNIISNYVWTKSVDGKTLYGHRLTAQCPEDKKDDPVLYPGWRGQNDDWSAYGLKYGTSTPKTNLAIKGLFKVEMPTKITVTYKKGKIEGVQEEGTIEETITSGITAATLDAILAKLEEKVEGSDGKDANVYSSITIEDQDGYTLNNWGAALVDNRTEYDEYLFKGFGSGNYDKAPIYFIALPPNTVGAGYTNGYGFE